MFETLLYFHISPFNLKHLDLILIHQHTAFLSCMQLLEVKCAACVGDIARAEQLLCSKSIWNECTWPLPWLWLQHEVTRGIKRPHVRTRLQGWWEKNPVCGLEYDSSPFLENCWEGEMFSITILPLQRSGFFSGMRASCPKMSVVKWQRGRQTDFLSNMTCFQPCYHTPKKIKNATSPPLGPI